MTRVYDLTLHQVVLRALAFVIIVATHGAAVAIAARYLGDAGVEHDGRLTASPVNHLDVVGFITAIVGLAGWTKSIEIDPARLRFGAFGALIVVLGGSLVSLFDGFIALWLRPWVVNLLPDSAATHAFAFIQVFAEMCFATALLNLFPVPPLTGALFLAAAAPGWRAAIGRAGMYVGFALLALALLGVLRASLWPMIDSLMRIALG